MITTDEAVQLVLETLSGRVYRAPTEDALQQTVAQLLDFLRVRGLRVVRELRLDKRNRVDLAIELPPARPVLDGLAPTDGPMPPKLVTVSSDGALVVVEIKLEVPTTPVVRQLQRYALCDRVAAVILASTSARLLAAVPRGELGGKPLYTAHLRRF